jgi:hypothetical protein
MEKITLASINFYSANKQGQTLLDKNQRPYQRVAVKTTDGRSMSGFAYQDSPIMKWQIGGTYEVETEQKGQYLNFRLPKKQEAGMTPLLAGMELRIMAKLESIEKKLDGFEAQAPDDGPDGQDLTAEDLGF